MTGTVAEVVRPSVGKGRPEICHLFCCYTPDLAICGVDLTNAPPAEGGDPVCIDCDMTDCPYLCPPGGGQG